MARNRANKKPAAVVPTSREKRPKVPHQQDLGEHMSWRFGSCDDSGPFEWLWGALETHLDKLEHFESQPWSRSETSGTVGAKRIGLASLSKDAQKRLRKLELDDADALWELRVAGKPRFWGFRSGHCFHFLWWDPDHQVCPSKR